MFVKDVILTLAHIKVVLDAVLLEGFYDITRLRERHFVVDAENEVRSVPGTFFWNLLREALTCRARCRWVELWLYQRSRLGRY